MYDTVPRLIAIDWGTSNFRAFLLDGGGKVLEKKFARLGVLKIRRSQFETILRREISEWEDAFGELPILMAGMVGSRQGWQEVPYLACPLALKTLGQNLEPVKRLNRTWIIPGLRMNYPDGRVDVMRGEETQILGAMNLVPPELQVFCLPGTHSKWAYTQAGELLHFNSFMTGEIFTLLRKHSILGRLMLGSNTDNAGFHRGLEWGARSDNLLAQIFQVRTQVLAGTLNTKAVFGFLAGILIAQELHQALQTSIPHAQVGLIANPRITNLYSRALSEHNIEGVILDSDQVTSTGLFKIAQYAQIL